MNFLPPFNLCCVTDALLEIFDRYSTDSACGILDGLPSFSDGWSTVCHAVRVPRSVFSGQEDPLVPDDFSLAIDLSFIPVDNVFLDLLRSAMLRATLRLVSQHTGQSAPHSFSESGGYLAAMQTDLKIGHRCRHSPTENKGYSLQASDEKTKSCKSQVVVASESVGKITFLYPTGMSK